MFGRTLAAVARRPHMHLPSAASGGSPTSVSTGNASGRGSPDGAWSLRSQLGTLPGSGSAPEPRMGCSAGHPRRLLGALVAALHYLRSDFAEGATLPSPDGVSHRRHSRMCTHSSHLRDCFLPRPVGPAGLGERTFLTPMHVDA